MPSGLGEAGRGWAGPTLGSIPWYPLHSRLTSGLWDETQRETQGSAGVSLDLGADRWSQAKERCEARDAPPALPQYVVSYGYRSQRNKTAYIPRAALTTFSSWLTSSSSLPSRSNSFSLIDLSHSDRKTCCHDDGLWGQDEDFCQCQRHHRGGQAYQPQVSSQGFEVPELCGGRERLGAEVGGRARLV